MSDNGLDLSGLMEDEAYDAAMDSLTQAERNKLLRELAVPAQPKAEPLPAPPRGRGPGVIRQFIGVTLEVFGTIIESVGKALVALGSTLRKWGYRVRV